MASFETAFLFTQNHEGGYANSKTDLGGETKYGISKRQYPNEDIPRLTLERAKFLLHHDYWTPLMAVEIAYQPLANHLYDMCVNAGQEDAVLALQCALVSCDIPITIDGIIGPKTITAANETDGVWLTDRYRVERVKHYLRRIIVNPDQIVNIKSWLRRAVA
jgi:lysozyme family protein